jgi:hypothetical protein
MRTGEPISTSGIITNVHAWTTGKFRVEIDAGGTPYMVIGYSSQISGGSLEVDDEIDVEGVSKLNRQTRMTWIWADTASRSS